MNDRKETRIEGKNGHVVVLKSFPEGLQISVECPRRGGFCTMLNNSEQFEKLLDAAVEHEGRPAE